jgi:electron transport complex protein RnfC
MCSKTWLTCGFAVGVAIAAGPAWGGRRLPFSPRGSAKANSGWNAINRNQQRIQQLNQAKRNFTKEELEAISRASAEIASAKAAHHAAVKEYQSTKESVEKSTEESLGLKKLREESVAAQRAYHEAADPVLHALKGTEEYQKVEKACEAAKARIQALKDDESLSEEEKKSRLPALIGESMAASSLERTTLQKDPRVQAAKQKLDAAQKKLADLQKKAHEKVEKDSTVAAAHEAVKNAFASIQAAEANLAAVESKAAVGEQMLSAGIIPKAPSQNTKGNTQGNGGKKN